MFVQIQIYKVICTPTFIQDYANICKGGQKRAFLGMIKSQKSPCYKAVFNTKIYAKTP